MDDDSPDIENAVLEAFRPLTTPSGSSLRRVLVIAFDFAAVAPSPISDKGSSAARTGIIVIDEHCLFKAIITHGLEVMNLAWSSSWLVNWLEAEGIKPLTLVNIESAGPVAPRRALREGGRISVSEGLRLRIVPEAQDLAVKTAGNRSPSLRHLHFATLRHAPLEWFGPEFRAEQRERLCQDFIIRNCQQYEDEEKGWRQAGEKAGHGSLGAPTNELRTTPRQAINIHPDTPETLDQLGREAFAQILASRMIEIQKALHSGGYGHDAFMLQLDGPWGSGKTTVLNFLKYHLRGSAPPWLIVEYNAWRNQHRRPPWWPLIYQVGETVSSLSWREAPNARRHWAWWRIRMRWVPVALIATLLSLFVYLSWRAVVGTETGLAKAILESVSALLALATLTGLIWASARKISLGSADASEAFAQSTHEPHRRIIQLFERLERSLGRPIAIFIDDLDRCNSAQVIELLEGIQTRLRTVPVVYVVAGDRRWISSSFEKHYADFTDQVGAPGRPLSDLFLHKVFQLSVSVPRLSPRRKQGYLRHLLGVRGETDRSKATIEVARRLADKTRYEELQSAIYETAEGSVEQEIMRAEAAKRITTPEATADTEHRLEKFADLCEANPRAMKLLLNALALAQAAMFLEGRDVAFGALARWTIVEMRWPRLAAHIESRWPEIAARGLRESDCPPPLADLLDDPEVKRVFGREGDDDQLTIEVLDMILS